jgi:hypothetical protein
MFHTPAHKQDNPFRRGAQSPVQPVQSIKEALESQEFYELMQAYRWSSPVHQIKTVDAFEAVKAFIIKHAQGAA